ncbi:MAG: DUF4405 domain-containing protein [Sedimentisphaerales bacterium]|nr:DUF4405 domain-containing protein [Sedimentisphaerales bacterium]
MSKETKIKFSWRAFFSLLAAVSFIGMTFTGVILFVVPPGRIANWSGWTMLALTKDQWIGLHDWFSIIFVVACGFHLYFNWGPFVSYFKSKITRAFALRAEWLAALVVCVIAFVGTVVGVSPFSTLMEWNESIKQSYDSPRQRGPVPHAELMTLNELADKYTGVELETMLENLRQRGIKVESPDAVLGELAETHGLTPAELYNIALGKTGAGRGDGGGRRGEGGGFGAQGGGGGSGFGRLTLKQYCEQAGLDVDTAVRKLNDSGYKASPNMTIRAIADSAGVHPSQVRAVIE